MTHMRWLHGLRWRQSTDHMEVWSFSLGWSLRSVTNWTRPGHLRRHALWDGSASCRKGRTSCRALGLIRSSGQRPKRTAKKLEGGRGASSAKGEDHEMSTEVGPEHEETVLVDPYDDDGAVNSPGQGTPEAAGATTEDAREEPRRRPQTQRNCQRAALSRRRALRRHCDGEDGSRRPKESLEYVFSNCSDV